MMNAGSNIINLLLSVGGGENILSDNVVSGININPGTTLPFSGVFNPLITENGDNPVQNQILKDNSGVQNNTHGFDFLLGGDEATETLSRESGLINAVSKFSENKNGEAVENELLFDARHTESVKGFDIELFRDLNNQISGVIDPDMDVSDNMARLLANENIGMPLQAVKTNKYLNDIINSQTVKLTDGAYNIIEAETVDNQLNLTVQAKDNPTQQIKITLPADLLEETLTGRKTEQAVSETSLTARAARVDLNLSNGSETQAKIEDLFAKLNLKEIQIKTAEPKADTVSVKNVSDVKIVAENAGQEVIIKGKINNEKIKTRIDRENVRAEVRDNSRIFSNVERETLPVKTIKTDGKVSQRLNLATQNPVNDFSLLEALSREKIDDGQFETSRLFQEVTFEQLSRSTTNQSVRTHTTPVRFSLPENISQTLKPNGQSVMLKIAPENLGTARLHLTMRHNSLTARVTVDNVPAKNAIESSLHQLTEQLSRSGIDVDYIEVGVSGDETQNQDFTRPTRWYKAGQIKGIDSDSEYLSDIDRITKPSSAPATYVGAGGVNLFA